MIRGTKYIQIGIAALVALAFSVSASAANYNSRYGPVLWKDLPLRGSVSKVIWVGSWWPYTKNGVAWRHRGDSIPSPAELFDEFMGNKDKIDLDLAKTYYEMVEKDLSPKQKRIQELVPTLNRMIERGETWQDTDEGKEYTTLRTEIDEAKKNLPTVPTESATMWEIIHSGRGVIGVGGWWGHCNAWSAAAIMDLEPRKNAVVNGVTFTPGDIKALLTEAWMEQSSSFFGTRNEYHGDEEARSKIDFRDVTPAAFHIFITDQIGNKDKSFVIDRFTGSEVWNQPMKAYRVTEVKKLYTDDTAVEKDLIVTEYDQWTGKATESTLQKQNVFPIQVTTTFHWVTDGLPPETLTADQDLTEVPDDGFSDSYTVSRLTDDQIDVRTLTYTLYLTKPLEDPAAEVVGD
ncbi:MAG: hypothetical protein KC609_14590, partial [Myxococcales bacterium]|nr:hypothetical protein [Myxococcales bacterium]